MQEISQIHTGMFKYPSYVLYQGNLIYLHASYRIGHNFIDSFLSISSIVYQSHACMCITNYCSYIQDTKPGSYTYVKMQYSYIASYQYNMQSSYAVCIISLYASEVISNEIVWKVMNHDILRCHSCNVSITVKLGKNQLINITYSQLVVELMVLASYWVSITLQLPTPWLCKHIWY